MLTRAAGPAWVKGCVRVDPHIGHAGRRGASSGRGSDSVRSPMALLDGTRWGGSKRTVSRARGVPHNLVEPCVEPRSDRIGEARQRLITVLVDEPSRVPILLNRQVVNLHGFHAFLSVSSRPLWNLSFAV